MIHVLLGPADFDGRIPDAAQRIFWQDDLSVGPVPVTKTLQELTLVRQDFWRSRELLPAPWNTDQEFVSASGLTHPHAFSLSQRDEQLDHVIGSSEELLIWCGLNRREILMLCAILRYFDSAALGDRVKLAWCPSWGPLSYESEQLVRFFEGRSKLPTHLSELCRELWDRYASPNPITLNPMIEQSPSLPR